VITGKARCYPYHSKKKEGSSEEIFSAAGEGGLWSHPTGEKEGREKGNTVFLRKEEEKKGGPGTPDYGEGQRSFYTKRKGGNVFTSEEGKTGFFFDLSTGKRT